MSSAHHLLARHSSFETMSNTGNCSIINLSFSSSLFIVAVNPRNKGNLDCCIWIIPFFDKTPCNSSIIKKSLFTNSLDKDLKVLTLHIFVRLESFK